MGRDLKVGIYYYKTHGFNPRARMGRDQHEKFDQSTSSSFNPRARMGRDIKTVLSTDNRYVSIHAPAWGATTREVPMGA